MSQVRHARLRIKDDEDEHTQRTRSGGVMNYSSPLAQSPTEAGVSSLTSQALQQPTAPTRPSNLRTEPVIRSRTYAFVLDNNGRPIELGSGRFAKTYLGEEVWLESKTVFHREVAIKILQRGVSEEDAMRFQMEKEILERVQGHPHIIHLFASGESDNPDFIPAAIQDKVEDDFAILELCDMSLEERLKGARNRSSREDLLSYPMQERIMRVLEYMLPVTSAIEYAHLVRNVCHRDIKPANILIRMPDPRLQGSILEVRLADFNVAKVNEEALSMSMTRVQDVPGTMFFQSPEQEQNNFEILVNVQQGSNEVDYFEDFFMYLCQNDTFQIFNRREKYAIVNADRVKKKLYLSEPFREGSETNVRGKITKSVDRPADIYSIGATFYYLVSGAYANPKNLYDAFHKFIEYESNDPHNSVEAYIDHEYDVIRQLWAPKSDEQSLELAPVDKFFSYKHYLDGNGELISKEVLKIIAKAMIRNKPDSYCQAWDVQTTGISELVHDMRDLYGHYGAFMPSRPGYITTRRSGTLLETMSRWWTQVIGLFRFRSSGILGSRGNGNRSRPRRPGMQ